MLGCHDYDGGEAIPYDTTYVKKYAEIGDSDWLGNAATIFGNIKIG